MCVAPAPSRQKTEKTTDNDGKNNDSKINYYDHGSPGARRPTDHDPEQFPNIDLPDETRDMVIKALEENRRMKDFEKWNADHPEGIGRAIIP